MLITPGRDFFDARNGRDSPIIIDTHKLINGHTFFVGASGVGKSHTLRNWIGQVVEQNAAVRFHVFDVHGDLEIPCSSIVTFSQSTEYGLNPLKVNPNRHHGGVMRCIRNFIRTINDSSRTPLGLKQEAVIRNLLLDVYKDFGFDPNDWRTWGLNEYESASLVSGGADNRLYLEVPFAEKNEASAYGARWDGARKLWWCHIDAYKGQLTKWKPAFKERTYPTVADLLAYARRMMEERFLGSDQKAVRALGYVNKRAQALQRKLLESVKQQRIDGLDAEDQAELDDAKLKAIEAYTTFVNSIQTGFELDNIKKYDPEELKSVINRIENLLASGIFKDNPPPFDPGVPVWRYEMSGMDSEVKKMFVLFLLRNIFDKAFERGVQNDVVEVVVLDELGVYCSASDKDEGDGIIGRIARESRKFGLALWGAHQSLQNVPDSLISSIATCVILGLSDGHYNAAMTKLGVERKLLEFVTPWKTLALQTKEKGSLKNRWRWVQMYDD